MVFPKFNWENSRFSILVEASKELYKNHGCLISDADMIYYLQLANLMCHNRQIKLAHDSLPYWPTPNDPHDATSLQTRKQLSDKNKTFIVSKKL
jgi:hypothetical protein